MIPALVLVWSALPPAQELPLVDGTTVRWSCQHREQRPSGWTASGRVLDGAGGSLVLVREGEEAAGYLLLGDGRVAILRERDGRWLPDWRALESIACSFEAEWHGTLDQGRLFPGAQASTSGVSVGATGQASQTGTVPACPCDDGNTVDLLIAYTAAAASQPNSAGVGFATFVQLTVGAMNQALAASSLPTRIRLVGAVQVDYDESGSTDVGVHQLRLADPVDGHLDGIHGVRDALAADLVALYVHIPGAGGVAYLPGEPEWGFSTTSTTTGLDTFAHEIGHNLGCAHDPGTELAFGIEPLEQELSYNHGHKFDAGGQRYATVMSYRDPGEVLLLQFSAPARSHLGVPTGIAPGQGAQPADNALVIRHSAGLVSSYRDDGFADCNGNGLNDRAEIAAGTEQDRNDDGVPDSCEIRFYADPNGAGGDAQSWASAWPDLKDALATASIRCNRVAELWLAEGEYRADRGRGKREMDFRFRRGSVRMFGGFTGVETKLAERDWLAHPSVLTGDLQGDDLPGFQNRVDNSYHLLHQYWGGRSATVIDGLVLRGGHADGAFPDDAGGALRLPGGTALVRNCRFEDNFATWGGAVNLYFVAEPARFVRCSFTGNQAGHQGGALQAQTAGRLHLLDCQFDDNRAAFGGALAVLESTATLEDCQLRGNQATTEGGGLLAWQSSLALRSCQFDDNLSGLHGGALFAYQTSVDLQDSVFLRNQAASEGGAIRLAVAEGRTIRVADSVFQQNHAGVNGGAVFAWYAAQTIVRSRFLANSADARGGAIWSGFEPHRISDCAFSGDAAGLEGGALYGLEPGPAARLINATILHAAPDAVFEWGGEGRIANGIFGESGAEPLRLWGASASEVRYSAVQFGFAGVGNLASLPTLRDPLGPDGLPGTGDEDLRLASGSPFGIDAGDNSVRLPGLHLDLLGRSRRRDDPGTPDTGLGSAPLIDLGALELQP